MKANHEPASNAEARRVARLTGEVTLETPTPFAAVVRTNRSKKAAKGTPVTVASTGCGCSSPARQKTGTRCLITAPSPAGCGTPSSARRASPPTL